MTEMELYDLVEQHPDLEGVAIATEPEPEVTIRHTKLDACWRIPLSVTDRLSADELLDYLSGAKRTDPIYHMTRVVGYFSRVENWNKSKIGELKDRHAGDYTLAE